MILHDIIWVRGGKTTFSEQHSLIRREFALNSELQQVISTPTDVLFILFVPSEPP